MIEHGTPPSLLSRLGITINEKATALTTAYEQEKRDLLGEANERLTSVITPWIIDYRQRDTYKQMIAKVRQMPPTDYTGAFGIPISDYIVYPIRPFFPLTGKYSATGQRQHTSDLSTLRVARFQVARATLRPDTISFGI